ncbi:MAG: hypothetical protein JAY97_17150 [Candidatus Thiodiazotropha sp. 'RUGA']|nr:hypothetical protein [Candidatus Thiodiazotropha sp. 'RUGA']
MEPIKVDNQDKASLPDFWPIIRKYHDIHIYQEKAQFIWPQSISSVFHFFFGQIVELISGKIFLRSARGVAVFGKCRPTT